MRHRKGERPSTRFRSDRLFSVNGEWFFATREGVDHGPFETRQDAEAALTEFLRTKKTADDRIINDPED